MVAFKRAFFKAITGYGYRYLARKQQLKELELSAGYFPMRYSELWLGEWREYYLQNRKNFPDIVDNLCESLDAQSQELVRRTAELNCHVLPTYGVPGYYCISPSLLTTEEKEALSRPDSYYKEMVRSCGLKSGGNVLEAGLVEHHCGLRYLPREVLQGIAGKDVIDGGAYWGDTALILQDYAPGRIYAFEAVEDNFNRIGRVVELNQCKHPVIPVLQGLGREKGTARISINNVCPSFTPGDLPAQRYEEVAVTSIDDFAAENGLDVGLIKLDVEGVEYAVMQGALKTLAASRPVLLISVYHRPQDFFEILPLLRTVVKDYVFQFRKYAGQSLNNEIMLTGYPA